MKEESSARNKSQLVVKIKMDDLDLREEQLPNFLVKEVDSEQNKENWGPNSQTVSMRQVTADSKQNHRRRRSITHRVNHLQRHST